MTQQWVIIYAHLNSNFTLLQLQIAEEYVGVRVFLYSLQYFFLLSNSNVLVQSQ